MNEREMLELAAKAAGIKIEWGEVFNIGDCEVDCTDLAFADDSSPGDAAPIVWNSLTDDGDALRLAVKLRIHIEQNKDALYGEFTLCAATGIRWNNRPAEWWDKNESPEAATRRAITRAAAEIGKAMP